MTRNRIFLIIILIIVLAGIGGGIFLVQNRQIFFQEAAVSDGPAQVTMSPTDKTINAGETFPVELKFTTGGVPIVAMAIQMEYTFTGDNSALRVEEVMPNSQLTQDGKWVYPVKKVTTQTGKHIVQVAAIYVDSAGYTTTDPVLFATLRMKGVANGTITMKFNNQNSKITKKFAAEDVLLTSTQSGTFTVASGVGGLSDATGTPTVTHTPTPTMIAGSTATPTATRTPTPATAAGTTVTPTPIGQLSSENGSPTPTKPQTLPVAAATGPTLAIGGMAVLFIVAGLWLMFI